MAAVKVEAPYWKNDLDSISHSGAKMKKVREVVGSWGMVDKIKETIQFSDDPFPGQLR